MNNPLRYVDPSGNRPILTDDPRKQTNQQTETLNMLSSSDESTREAAEKYVAIKSGRNPDKNNTNIEKTDKINDNSYMRSSIYKKKPEYVNDLYKKSNDEYLDNLEPADPEVFWK